MDNSQIAAMIAEAVAAAFAATNNAASTTAGTTDTNSAGAPETAASLGILSKGQNDFSDKQLTMMVNIALNNSIDPVALVTSARTTAKNAAHRNNMVGQLKRADSGELKWADIKWLTKVTTTPAASTPAASTPAASTPAASTPAATNPFIPVAPIVGTREDVRRWARQQGMAVHPRGALKREVVEAYNAAHAASTPAASTPAASTPAASTPAVTSSVANADWVTVQLAPDVTVRVKVGQIGETRARWPEMMIVGYGG